MDDFQAIVQKGIFNESLAFSHFMEFRLNVGAERFPVISAVRSALTGHHEGVEVVVAFSQPCWALIQPKWQPSEVASFQEIEGAQGHLLPATQQDVLFWIQSDHKGDMFDSMFHIAQMLKAVATLTLEVEGFRTRENRDLTGFVEEVGNPRKDERYHAACIPEFLPGNGGSYLITQKWQHNLAGFFDMSPSEQEAVVGRTKKDNRPLKNSHAKDSHVARMAVQDDGETIKLYRRSTPFGNASEHGLYFVGCSASLQNIQMVLESVVGLSEEGLVDQAINYSKPVSGSFWFAPNQQDLEELLFSTNSES